MVVMVLAVSSTFAQKFGHINSQQLLVESPLVKTADEQIIAYQAELEKQGIAMREKFDTDYKKYGADIEAGTLNQIQAQQKESELQAQQQAMQQFLVSAQQKLAIKREELYKPILDKVKVAMEQVGKDGNYTMIFDTSTNGLLFAVEGEDLLSKVKAKLGW